MEELVMRVDEKCGWLYGQMLPMREALMLIREHIAQLVGQALGVALFSSTRKLQFYVELACCYIIIRHICHKL